MYKQNLVSTPHYLAHFENIGIWKCNFLLLKAFFQKLLYPATLLLKMLWGAWSSSRLQTYSIGSNFWVSVLYKDQKFRKLSFRSEKFNFKDPYIHPELPPAGLAQNSVNVVVNYSTFDFSSMYFIPLECYHPAKVLNTAQTAFITKVT